MAYREIAFILNLNICMAENNASDRWVEVS